MAGKRGREALLGGALGGDPDPGEQARLANLLAQSPESRAELERLQAFLADLPADAPEPPFDLLPGVRARLAESPAHAWRDWRLAGAVGLCAAASLLVLAPMVLPERPEAATASVGEPAAPVRAPGGEQSLSMASVLLYEQRYAEAYDLLADAVTRFPEEPFAARAQQQLAELDFAEFQRYDKAYDGYQTLRSRYPGQFAADPENANRLDLLDEARRYEFASLNEFDAARTRRTGRLEALEQVLARYASSHELAPLVAEEMADALIAGGAVDAADGPMRVRALELARNRCGDPLAAARLDLEIGKAYLRDEGDARAARQHGERVLSTGDPELVELARGFLSSFDTPAE
jgi:hypothetical protein